MSGSTNQTNATTPAEAERRQATYAASRRAWAEAVGRPYQDDPDLRPPPGQLEGEADE
ncbi:MAG: hypothetical protein JWO83_4723 [Caulobacteraceae bacterium]|jgi:hypothetical protein|nr:hypothetical protein [Caulobacteraceae bacterium]